MKANTRENLSTIGLVFLIGGSSLLLVSVVAGVKTLLPAFALIAISGFLRTKFN